MILGRIVGKVTTTHFDFKVDVGAKKFMFVQVNHSEVLRAEDEFVKTVVLPKKEHGAYLGYLDGKTIPVYLNPQRLLTPHVAVLAKSGSGKSYTVGVLLEEIMQKRI